MANDKDPFGPRTFAWRPIAQIADIEPHETVLATTEFKAMVFRAEILRIAVAETTPEHLRFPATRFVLMSSLL